MGKTYRRAGEDCGNDSRNHRLEEGTSGHSREDQQGKERKETGGKENEGPEEGE